MISLYIRGLSRVRWLTRIPLLEMIIIYEQCIPNVYPSHCFLRIDIYAFALYLITSVFWRTVYH